MKYTYLVFLSCFLCIQQIRAQQTDTETKTIISEQTKNEVLDSLFQKLNDDYVFPKTAVKIEKTIRQYQKQGCYLKIKDAKTFAETLTDQIFAIAHDKHLSVSYQEAGDHLPEPSAEDEKEEAKRIRRFKIQKNFGFTKIDILEGNIGYLKIDAFFPVDDAGPTATAAMNYIANTDALIIDLRSNHGGEPEMVRFLASHFFDTTPVHLNDLYWREGNKTIQYWSLPYVSAKRYVAKPVYIMIDGKTFSAGEEFAYDLQALRRATVTGTASAGGANPGNEVKIKGQFVAFIPNGRAVNPLTKTNWEGVGVQPDIEMSGKDALPETQILALQKLIKTTSDQRVKEYFQKNLDKIRANIK